MFYYRCTFCRLDICGICFQFGKHPWTHLPSLIRLRAQETKVGDKRQDKLCSSCNSMKHGRLDCDECEYRICSSCFSNEKSALHDHRSFMTANPPGLTLCAVRATGPACCLESSFGHCGRCCSRKSMTQRRTLNLQSTNCSSLETRRIYFSMQNMSL